MTTPFEAIDAFVASLENVERALVVSHIHPDGDAVGSTLAMGLVLEAAGKEVIFYNRHDVPYNFQFLTGAERWTTDVPEDAEVDLTVVLDCAEPARIGEDFPQHGWGKKTFVVDHHKTWDEQFADLYVRDVSAAATGELVYHIAKRLGVLNQEIAECLYCCLMTDTGSFRYSNTSQETFNIAGELVAMGVNPWHMTSNVYESQPRERLELLAKVLGTLEFSECGRLAFLRVDEAMMGDVPDLTLIDGFINYARSVRGVEVATQLLRDGDVWKVSFRSRGAVDVSELAARFGGGGHHNAAGCRIAGESDRVQDDLSRALVDLLDG